MEVAAEQFNSRDSLLGLLIGDLKDIVRLEKVERKIAPSRILRHSPDRLFGRESWLDALDQAWEAKDTVNIYTLVAWGGVGKTSLVAHWVNERFLKKGWRDVERYFDWSFYSQGTGESRQTSSDLFIDQALRFFGDPDPKLGSPWERGERLAGLVKKYSTLLVLDGIEPLQNPPNDRSGQAGMLKDQALEALLHGLALDNPGLCVVTTRETLTNLRKFRESTAPEQKLDKLLREAAIALLRHLQIVGSEEEIEAAWQDAGGHALTLQLLGRFIVDVFPDRDICHYRQVKFEQADLERQGRSAFKVMIAYERWLQDGDAERQRESAILRLTGLFDRPISSDCLAVLRTAPAISGLTDAHAQLTNHQWNSALKRLKSIDLITPQNWLLDIALDHLTLARAKLYRAILEPTDSDLPAAAHSLDQALKGLRQVNDIEFVVSGLLTASLLESVKGEEGRVKAEAYLAEAQQIVERGPMPLYLADVHLYRGRMKAEG